MRETRCIRWSVIFLFLPWSEKEIHNSNNSFSFFLILLIIIQTNKFISFTIKLFILTAAHLISVRSYIWYIDLVLNRS